MLNYIGLSCALAWTGIAGAAAPACPSTGDADLYPTFDAALLKEGRFVYHTTIRGESLGETVLEIRRNGANYVISMSAPKIAQAWKATVNQSFAPVSASLEMRGKKGVYSMKLEYAGATISGEEREGGVTKPVNARVEGVVLDQRVDWAAMMVANAPAKSSFAVRVFDPSTGSSTMLGKTGGTQEMSGAWGAAAAVRLHYTICKSDHLEEYTVYATQATPRYMVREDMPNGLVSELIRIEP
jgi:hypothetical protein